MSKKFILASFISAFTIGAGGFKTFAEDLQNDITSQYAEDFSDLVTEENPEFIPGSMTSDEISAELGLPTEAECNSNPELEGCYIIEPAGGANVRVEVSLNLQQASVYVNGKYRATYLVSTGMPGYGTPTGTFRVWGAEKDKVSKKYGGAMPNALPFTEKYHALHCGNVSAGFLSHGCVRVERQGCVDLWTLQETYGHSAIQVRISNKNPNVVPTNRSRGSVAKKATKKANKKAGSNSTTKKSKKATNPEKKKKKRKSLFGDIFGSNSSPNQ